MNKEFRSILLLIILTTAAAPTLQPNALPEKRVLRVEVNDFISQALAEHIDAAVRKASEPGFTAILFTINTFGGSADSMLKIIDSIHSSPVPVIGFVYPPGKQALSAGVFILMATDYAAMAPYTTIGSSQPVVGTTPTNETKIIKAFSEKIANLAKLHSRNATQAVRFITHNDNLSPEAALAYDVIEAMAETPRELLESAHGVKVKTLSGEKLLDTKNAVIESFEPSVRVHVLRVVTDPMVSSLFIAIGFLALILGLTSPGWGAEVLGVILLLLGLVGQGFNVNYAALALMAIGASLLVIEIYTPGFGVMGIGGLIVMGIGMALTVSYPVLPTLVSQAYVDLFIQTVAAVLSAAGVFFGFVIFKAAKAVKMKRSLETYPKGEGRAVDALEPGKAGYIVVQGEYWKAKTGSRIESNMRVRVIGMEEGKVLIVEPVCGEKEASYHSA